MKVFISQPMRGKKPEEILEERNKIIELLKTKFKADFTVLDSYFQKPVENATPLWYLSRSLAIMSEADIVVFAKGWEKYRGCKIERECARAYNYICRYL